MSDSAIAFQGIEGAYSHLACQMFFGSRRVVPCFSFEATLEAVIRKKAELALIPVENSLGGRVFEIHRLLATTPLFICGEHFFPVHHCLAGVSGASFETIRYVHSHPQALTQCRKFIERLKSETISSSDTAHAAREIANTGDRHHAAVCSELAARLYGLQILQTDIADQQKNITRFFVMTREEPKKYPKNHAITSLYFRVRSVPASLYKALGGFATNGVNLTKIESYILDSSFTTAQFFIEIEGSPEQQKVQNALEELEIFSSEMRVLGCYEMDVWRRPKP